MTINYMYMENYNNVLFKFEVEFGSGVCKVIFVVNSTRSTMLGQNRAQHWQCIAWQVHGMSHEGTIELYAKSFKEG